VRFRYQKAGAEEAERRTIEPWGVLSWHGRWYVAGYDRDRGEPRSFRLSRIAGRVETIGRAGEFRRPESVDLVGMVTGRAPESNRLAQVRISGPGTASLRRLASAEEDAILTIPFVETGWLARQVAAAGPAAQVLGPADLVDAVVRLLSAAAGVRR
jgi:proteasome accessory factor B